MHAEITKSESTPFPPESKNYILAIWSEEQTLLMSLDYHGNVVVHDQDGLNKYCANFLSNLQIQNMIENKDSIQRGVTNDISPPLLND